MIDMKLSHDQSPAAMMGLMGNQGENTGPAYPEGLQIELEGEALKRLAIGEGNLPQVGQKFQLCAIVEVIEVCKEDGQTEAGYCVEMQIQAMELNPPETLNEQQKAHAQITRLYG